MTFLKIYNFYIYLYFQNIIFYWNIFIRFSIAQDYYYYLDLWYISYNWFFSLNIFLSKDNIHKQFFFNNFFKIIWESLEKKLLKKKYLVKKKYLMKKITYCIKNQKFLHINNFFSNLSNIYIFDLILNHTFFNFKILNNFFFNSDIFEIFPRVYYFTVVKKKKLYLSPNSINLYHFYINDFFNFSLEHGLFYSYSIERRGLNLYRLAFMRYKPLLLLNLFSLYISWQLSSELYNIFIICSYFTDKYDFFTYLNFNLHYWKYVINYFKDVIAIYPNFLSSHALFPHEFLLKIKIKRTNIFFTILDSISLNTLFKISGGFSYLYGSEANKEKAKKKKLKFKTIFKAKKKRKDFKKISSFSLDFMLENLFKFINDFSWRYKILKIIFIGSSRSSYWRFLWNYIREKTLAYYYVITPIFIDGRCFNGMKKKKERRI